MSEPPETTPAEPDAWSESQKILVLLAHPDDPEFFCGGTLARWATAGHEIIYWLFTCGDKGTSKRDLQSETLCTMRQEEQQAAASIIGAKQVFFSGYPDGYLVPNLEMRKEVTRIIRTIRPDIIMTCDPTALFVGGNRLNHPDHRAAGQVVLDAVFPAARDHLNFIELWRDEGLEPHIVREVWVSVTNQPDTTLNVTPYWETKINALKEHKSQIGDPEGLAKRMRERLAQGSNEEAPRYEESFRRLILG